MMQDNSREFEDTWNFLDRQLACCVQIGQCASAVITIFCFHLQVMLKSRTIRNLYRMELTALFRTKITRDLTVQFSGNHVM